MEAAKPPPTKPSPMGEGLVGATLRVNLYKGQCPIKNHSRPFLWKGQTSEAACTCQQKLDTKLNKLGI